MLLALTADGLLDGNLVLIRVNIPRLSQPLAEIKAVSIASGVTYAPPIRPRRSGSRHRVPPVDHAALAGIDQQLGYLKIIGDHRDRSGRGSPAPALVVVPASR